MKPRGRAPPFHDWFGMSFDGRPDELLAGQSAVTVLVEIVETRFKIVLSLQPGLVFFESENAVGVGVPARKRLRPDFGGDTFGGFRRAGL